MLQKKFDSANDNDLKQTGKTTQELLEGKKFDIIQWPSQSHDRNQTKHVFIY